MAEKLEIIVSATDKASSVLGGIKGALGGLGGLAKGALLGGVGIAATAASSALGGVTAGLELAINEAVEAEGVLAQLDAVLESTGGAAGVSRDMVTYLADSLMSVTRFGDEAILSGENILLTFTKIGETVFPTATRTMLDMSQALGQDIKTSAIQLGKALQDPINGVTALRRVGVNFTGEQQKMIKELVKGGDVARAQALILAELQTEFGGSAEAAGGTLAGQLEILKNTMSNVAEEAGMVLLPILTEGLQGIAPILIDLAENFAAFISSDEFKAWLTEVAAFVRDQVIPAISAFASFTMDTLIPAMVAAGKWIGENLIPVLKDIFAWLGEHIPPVIQGLVKLFTVDIPGALSKLKQKWDSDFGGIKTLFTGVFNHVKLVFEAFRKAFSGDWRGFGETIRKIVDNSWDTIKKVFAKSIENIKKLFFDTDWGELGKSIIQGIATGLGKFLGLLVDAAKSVASAVVEAFRGFLLMESPSRVMADKVGAPMAAGISQGLLGGLRDLAVTATAGIQPVVSSLAAPFGGMAPAYAGVSGRGSQSGVQVVVQYSPMVSFADEFELEQRLRPVIQRAMRQR